MKNILIIIVLYFITVETVSAQITAKVYEVPNVHQIISTHKNIAILPMDVTVRDTKSKAKNRLSPEALAEMEDSYREGFQNSMYAWFLKMKQKGKLGQGVQDVTRTNAILRKNGITTNDDLLVYTFDEVAKMLNVDAVFYGNVTTTHSFSKGGAVALQLLTGTSTKTGDADVIVKLYNGTNGEMIWSFDRTVASSTGHSPEDIADYLMKRVSKRFPYRLK